MRQSLQDSLGEGHGIKDARESLHGLGEAEVGLLSGGRNEIIRVERALSSFISIKQIELYCCRIDLLRLGLDLGDKVQLADAGLLSIGLDLNTKLLSLLVPGTSDVKEVVEGELVELVIRSNDLHVSTLEGGCLGIARAILSPLP